MTYSQQRSIPSPAAKEVRVDAPFFVVEGSNRIPINGRLFYTDQDPTAVTLAFAPDIQTPADEKDIANNAVWTFARTLLADGQDGQAGQGDVRCQSMGNEIGVRLESPDGLAVIALP